MAEHTGQQLFRTLTFVQDLRVALTATCYFCPIYHCIFDEVQWLFPVTWMPYESLTLDSLSMNNSVVPRYSGRGGLDILIKERQHRSHRRWPGSRHSDEGSSPRLSDFGY